MLLWEHGNAALKARNFFSVAKGKSVRNDFGATLGGPSRRNKAFFLVNVAGQRTASLSAPTASLPTLKMREGDFSQLLALSPRVIVKNPTTGQPFADNIIPKSRQYAGSPKYQDRFYPVPNYGAPELFVSNFRQNVPAGGRQDHVDGRVDYHFSDPNMFYARFTYQRSFHKSVEGGARLSYIGTRGVQLLYSRDINQVPASTQPYSASRRSWPLYRTITRMENGGSSIYHALSAEAERKWSRGLYFQAAWTWERSLTDDDEFSGTGEGGITLEDAYDRRRERADSSYLPRHRFFANLIWELPFGSGRRLLNRQGLLNGAFGGWQLSATYMAQTGLFFTPSYSGLDVSHTDRTSGRPDRIANGNLPADQRTVAKWFDYTAFKVPPPTRGASATPPAPSSWGLAATP